MFSIKDPNYAMRDESIALQPKFKNKTFGYRSFSYYGAKVWNSVPSNLKTQSNQEHLYAFKKTLHDWLFTFQPEHLVIF